MQFARLSSSSLLSPPSYLLPPPSSLLLFLFLYPVALPFLFLYSPYARPQPAQSLH